MAGPPLLHSQFQALPSVSNANHSESELPPCTYVVDDFPEHFCWIPQRDNPGGIPAVLFPYDTSPFIMLLFHGFDEDLGLVAHAASGLTRVLKAAILIMEYPGYGIRSNETFSCSRVLKDSGTVTQFVVKEMGFKAENIIVAARNDAASLGISIVNDESAIWPNSQCGGLLLINPQFCKFMKNTRRSFGNSSTTPSPTLVRNLQKSYPLFQAAEELMTNAEATEPDYKQHKANATTRGFSLLLLLDETYEYDDSMAQYAFKKIIYAGKKARKQFTSSDTEFANHIIRFFKLYYKSMDDSKIKIPKCIYKMDLPITEESDKANEKGYTICEGVLEKAKHNLHLMFKSFLRMQSYASYLLGTKFSRNVNREEPWNSADICENAFVVTDRSYDDLKVEFANHLSPSSRNTSTTCSTPANNFH